LIVASNRLEIAKALFGNLVNLEDAPFDLVGVLEEKPFDIDLESALQAGVRNRPDLRQEEARVHMLEQRLTSIRAEHFPSLRATAAYTASNPDPLAPFDSESQWGYHWNAGLVLDWSILDGGLTRGKMLEARLTLAKEQANMHELKKAIRLGITESYLDMTHALEAIKGNKENVALAEKALAIAEIRYKEGLSTYLEYTETNLALSTAQLTHFHALHAHLCATARLRYACGLTDEHRNKESQQ
ncbi:TolC family protein, partial [Verrucomicrobiota bacterium]